MVAQRVDVFGLLYQGAIEVARMIITSPKKRGGSVPEADSATLQETTCDRCTIHSEISNAYGVLQGLVHKGSSPEESQRAIEVARKHINNATVRLPDAAMISPETTEVATDLAHRLVDLDKNLVLADNVADIEQAHEACGEALDQAYRIQEQVFNPPDRLDIAKHELARARAEIGELKEQAHGSGESGAEDRASGTEAREDGGEHP